MINKIDILAIGVHPDDIELGCAGTIVKHIELGFTVGGLDLTQGELGTRGSAELRLVESNNASKIMGLTFRENLGFEDGFVTADNKQYQLEIVKKYVSINQLLCCVMQSKIVIQIIHVLQV